DNRITVQVETASLLSRHGRGAEAETYLKNALSDSSPKARATLLSVLAQMYAVDNRYGAEELLKQAVESNMQAFDRRGPNVAQSLLDLGSYYAVQNQNNRAEETLLETLPLLDEFDESDMYDSEILLVTAQTLLGSVQYRLKKYAAAEEALTTAIRLSHDKPKLISLYRGALIVLGRLLQETHREAETRELEEKLKASDGMMGDLGIDAEPTSN
ncbi:MAG TPA: hypothetical protein V6C72_05575, partial [Chroococcales cyanobacterium]